jgi:hypothetical protein
MRTLLGVFAMMLAIGLGGSPAQAADPEWHLLVPCWDDPFGQRRCEATWDHVGRDVWVPVTGDLSAYAGKAVAIRFRF